MMNLSMSELLVIRLRRLYEGYGYKKYKMEKFEPYDMYMEHKSFLKYEGILTFTNPNGSLMALKPDVTMGIIKNLPDSTTSLKCYYDENVFRLLTGALEYSEINQVGLEFIGGDYRYGRVEAILLAALSLKEINEDFILSVAHMDIINAFADSLELNKQQKRRIFELLKQKNRHGLAQFAEQIGVAEDSITPFFVLLDLASDYKTALVQLNNFKYNHVIAEAIEELTEIYESLATYGVAEKIRIDFSVLDDPEYYNGVVFQGFISGVPKAVLYGGRYDKLMQSFGKDQSAIGFALYLGEITGIWDDRRDYDADLLLIYGECTPKQVMEQIFALRSRYPIIRAEKEFTGNISSKETLDISEVD